MHLVGGSLADDQHFGMMMVENGSVEKYPFDFLIYNTFVWQNIAIYIEWNPSGSEVLFFRLIFSG